MRSLVLGLSLFVLPAGALADPCTRECRATRRGCVQSAKLDRTAMRADCTDLGEGKPCMKDAARRTRTVVGACRTVQTQCKHCCSHGGTGITCRRSCDGTPLASTWSGIQKIFATHGCTDAACHGAARQGGLELSPAVAYRNLLEVPATTSDLSRLRPGDERRSFLFLKLAAATDPAVIPAGTQVGAPMPNGGKRPLDADELEVVRKWIYAGAPETGTVAGTDRLLSACLPPPSPIRIYPLAAPPIEQGFQFRLPVFHLKAHSEVEYCFATYYDLTQRVPGQFKDPSGSSLLFNGREMRQDPQSHHTIVNRYAGAELDPHDPAFGQWLCVGGKKNSTRCEPLDLDACGSDSACVAWGLPHCEGGPRDGQDCDPGATNACVDGGRCIHGPRRAFACVGFGPQDAGGFTVPVGGAQKAQAFAEFPAGVYATMPLKGVLFWNPHAFNLSDRDTAMHGYLNFYYTSDTRWPVRRIFNTSRIFAPNAAPFSKQELCQDHVLPQGTYLYSLTSHTHRHGEYFWITGPDGTVLYENFVYNDPPDKLFDPPLVFDAVDPATRTLRYCARFNNGLTADGAPDVELVTRASRVPPGAPRFSRCKPTACVAGRVTAACTADRDCDSAPGAGDGRCDACRITGGESTENEMFILGGQYYVP